MQLRNRTCTHCKIKYLPIRKDQKFCSAECKTKHHNQVKAKRTQAKVQRRKLKLPYTAFWQSIARECRRSGTVQILQGHTAESLYDLYKLRKQTTLASGISQGEVIKCQFELSHITPSSGHSEYVGLLHSHNLIIAPFAFNRSRGSKYTSGGLYIKRRDLADKWRVRDKDSVKEIFAKMHAFLGTELDSFLSENVLTITQREQLIRKIIKKIKATEELFDEEDESCLRYKLNSLEPLELKEKAASLEISVNDRSITSKSELTVLYEELSRCVAFGHNELTPLLVFITAFYTKKNCIGDDFDTEQNPIFQAAPGIDLNGLKQSINTACWLALHGDAYSATHEGKDFLSCLTLGPVPEASWQPVLELEKALLDRDGQPETYEQYHQRRDAQRIANTPIWEIRDESIFPEDMDAFDRVYSCSIEHLYPSDPWLEYRDCPF